jgi:hypothetical protein
MTVLRTVSSCGLLQLLKFARYSQIYTINAFDNTTACESMRDFGPCDVLCPDLFMLIFLVIFQNQVALI